MTTTPTKTLTIGALRALIRDLPDDIVVLDSGSEERVLMEGETRLERDAGTTDEDFNYSDDNRDASEGGFCPVFPAVLHLNSRG